MAEQKLLDPANIEQLKLQALALRLPLPEGEEDPMGPELREFYARLLAGAYEHITTIQAMIDEALEHRDFDSLIPF